MKHISLTILLSCLSAQTLAAEPISAVDLTSFFTAHQAAASGGHLAEFFFDHTHPAVLAEQADLMQMSIPELQAMLIESDAKQGQDIEMTTVRAFIDAATTGQTAERSWALIPIATTLRSSLSRTSSDFCTLFGLFEDKGQLFILSARDGKISASLLQVFPDLATVPITTQPDCAAPLS